MIFSSTTPLPSLFSQLLIHKAVDRLAVITASCARERSTSRGPATIARHMYERTILDGVTGSEGGVFFNLTGNPFNTKDIHQILIQV